LAELQQELVNGSLDGVSVHAITSEKCSNEELMCRLAARNLDKLGFNVHSDPESKLLLRLKEDIDTEAPLYAREWKEASAYRSRTSVPYEDHELVQPALTVVDQNGDVKQFWSWLVGPSKNLAKEPMIDVPGFGMLVSLRPISLDIIPSIREKRDVNLRDIPW
jgi:hypothetical protein